MRKNLVVLSLIFLIGGVLAQNSSRPIFGSFPACCDYCISKD